jgi:cyclase
MRVAIIDYQSGNIASVANGLKRLGVNYTLTRDPEELKDAGRVILPGVGRAAPAMAALKKQGLDMAIREVRVPFLGICLGMQLLLPFSEEDDTRCLGIVQGRVKRFSSDGDRRGDALKIPHMGWNRLHQMAKDPLFRGVSRDPCFYFVHSYYVEAEEDVSIAKTRYGKPFVSGLKCRNFYGVQFHPEKSGEVGLKLLRNFCRLPIPSREAMHMIPAIDILDDKCVRLIRGDYSQSKVYSNDPMKTARTLQRRGVSLLHIVDLNGAREGCPRNMGRILAIARSLDIPVQVGGGIRTVEDGRAYLDGGAHRVILGTAVLTDPKLVKRLIAEYGDDRIVAAVDVREGLVAIRGWQEVVDRPLFEYLGDLKELGVKLVLVTDIGRDGTLSGPDFTWVEKILEYGFRVIVAGGVSSDKDLQMLDSMGAYGAVIGKALYEGRVSLGKERTMGPKPGRKHRCDTEKASGPLKRIIPCMDIRDGRVVKGESYVHLRDAGDPVELGKRYSDMGADELVYLDIMATVEKRDALYSLVERISKNITIPFAVGGGITVLETIRNLLHCGADKVSIGSAAILNPGFVRAAAEEFGSQCIVISLDPKRSDNGWELYIKGGREAMGVDAIAFAKQMARLGAGELLVNSMDRDGRRNGYDIELLRTVSETVNIPVIASSGAGRKEHFLHALTQGKADAVLAAGLFHFGELEISELKVYLQKNGIPIRL